MSASRIRLGRAVALSAIAASFLCTACVLRGPSGMKRDLSSASGVELQREMGLTLGPTSLWIARHAGAFDDEDVELRGLRKIQVGVYRVLDDSVDEAPGMRLDRLEQRGWKPFVRVHEADEDAAVLVRESAGRVRSLVVVVAESDEWTIVRLEGDLDALLEDALELAFDKAGKPALYEASRRERGLEAAGQKPPSAS